MGNKIQATFEGDEYPSRVRELVNEWYKNVQVVTKQVDKVEVNPMNKLVRTAEYQ